MLYIHTYVRYIYIYICTCITYTIDKSLTLKIDSHDRNLCSIKHLCRKYVHFDLLR